MRLKEIQHIFQSELKEIYDEKEIDTLFFRLTGDFCGISRLTLALQPEITLTREEEQPLFEALARLKEHKPVQQILGKADFYGLEFKVDEHVLIPRPETEELVAWICKDHEKEKGKGLTLLDIGTGSGCIAVSLAVHLPLARVAALDVSKKALAIAKENASRHKAHVGFIHLDILAVEDIPISRLDIIVSNPPYIRNLEKSEIKNNVLLHEPHRALFVEDTAPLVFYEKIARLAWEKLQKGGKLYFEINQYLGKETVDMLKGKGFKNIELRKDLSGNDRMIKATKK
ncbi:peptide chain release factor N(5)-glutamine methyltransferase [Sinomicrobium weinanense]|uniref:Release factor glutamine methyltransferase n=1 Tax=Sinomicrobium weinanense TaxID=2842200 RepID=A0A926Q4U2_9FLAO|nr:peptide chain release factor N(5)-glutamine methyltransferase [Sinomicrobium weinanense]MBC9798354.1 peptide chain release factor N(5)-glutamine methyltransferase [Sinomicrobium weinanense]MBU3122499.1 peptide chain release factor N(5)-glutamine methyltransferase [Sinomicrobium weinanense]